MKFSEFTESKKLNEAAPVVIAGVTFTAAQLTAMLVFGGSLAAMMTAYNSDPEAFKKAFGNPAATVAMAWQETQDLANQMMGNETGWNDEQSFDEANAAAQAKASGALGTILATNQKLTPDQRTAISAIPANTSTITTATISDAAEIEKRSAEIRAQVDALADAQAAATAARSAEINAQVDKAADARNAAAATNAVVTTAAGMPAAKAPPVNAAKPDTTAAGMPAAKATATQALTPAQKNAISTMPKAPEKNDVDITSGLPDVVSSPKTKADIARGGATGEIAGAPPIVAPIPGITLPGVGGLAGIGATIGVGALAKTARDFFKGKGGGKKIALPGLPILDPKFKMMEPDIKSVSDPLNLRRNI